MEMPVEFHCGVVTFGVVDLNLLLVFVKLTGIWVPSTLFVQCFEGIKFMANISLSTTKLLKVKKSVDGNYPKITIVSMFYTSTTLFD